MNDDDDEETETETVIHGYHFIIIIIMIMSEDWKVGISGERTMQPQKRSELMTMMRL